MLKVLLVDDNVTDLNGVANFVPWEKIGCTLIGTARDGAEGLEKARKNPPDLVITDISMPRMDGMRMCSEIIKELPNISIIFLSCLEDFEYAKEAIKFRNCDYITKPVIIDEVVKSILKIKKVHEAEIEKQLTVLNLEKQLKRNMPYLVKSFWRDVLFGISLNHNAIRRRADEYGIDISDKYMIVVFELSDRSSDQAILTQLLSNLLNNILLEELNGWVIDYKYNSFAAVLCGEVNIEELISLLDSIRSMLIDVEDSELMICIGRQNTSFFGLHDDFEKICTVLSDNYFYSSAGMIFADEFQHSASMQSNVNFVQLTKDISVILSISDDNAISAFTEKYLRPSNEIQLKSVACYILVNVNMILYKMNISFDSSEMFGIENVMECKTFAEIKEFMTRLLICAKNKICSTPTTSAEYIVNGIKQIINDNYKDILTLEDIAEKLHFNLIYANRVFKQETNITIYEYLLNFRMEKAKELLASSELKVYEVGEAVGYGAAKYFSTVFKNYIGMTPKQYRLKCGEKEVSRE